MGAPDVSYAVAFMAGLLSFLSPCVLPLVPSYLSFIAGTNLDELSRPAAAPRWRWHLIAHALCFIGGFTLIFVALGATATYLGTLVSAYQHYVRWVGGTLVVGLGLMLTGLFRIPGLDRDRVIQWRHKPVGFAGSVAVGMAFAVGWTPCVGPALAAILVYASTAEQVGRGVALLLTYAAGLGVPFLLCAAALGWFVRHVRWVTRQGRVISVASGLLLILVGVAIITNAFSRLTGWLALWIAPSF